MAIWDIGQLIPVEHGASSFVGLKRDYHLTGLQIKLCCSSDIRSIESLFRDATNECNESGLSKYSESDS